MITIAKTRSIRIIFLIIYLTSFYCHSSPQTPKGGVKLKTIPPGHKPATIPAVANTLLTTGSGIHTPPPI